MTCTHGTKSGPCAHCQEIAHEVKLAVAEMKERCAKLVEKDEHAEWLAPVIRALKDEP